MEDGDSRCNCSRRRQDRIVEFNGQSGEFLLRRGVSQWRAQQHNTRQQMSSSRALALRLSLSRRSIHNPRSRQREAPTVYGRSGQAGSGLGGGCGDGRQGVQC